jgi:hypothetical protein
MKRSPFFIGIGAQKAGTAWIYNCLREHPQICMALRNGEREISFFDRDYYWKFGYSWYEDFFEQCDSNKKTGEFSTLYLPHPDVPKRIHQRYPHIRLIASLRNPVDRALSNHRHDIISGRVKRGTPFLEMLPEAPEYIERGRYAAQLRRFLHYFSREQILVLFFDDMRSDPHAFVQGIYHFLDVDPAFIPSVLTKKVHVSEVARLPLINKLMYQSGQFLRQQKLGIILHLIKKSGLSRTIYTLNRRVMSTEAENFDPVVRQTIYSMLKEDIADLEQLLGRQLMEWHVL